MPEEKATAVPCSSAPMASSSADVVGAASRAYSMEPPAWNADAGTIGRVQRLVRTGRRAPGAHDDRLDGQRVGLGHTPTLAAVTRARGVRSCREPHPRGRAHRRPQQRALDLLHQRPVDRGGPGPGALRRHASSASVATGDGCASPDGGLGILAQDGPLPEIAADAPAADLSTCLDADVVFPVLHGPWGEDGTVQGLLETRGRPLRRVGGAVVGGGDGQGLHEGRTGECRARRRPVRGGLRPRVANRRRTACSPTWPASACPVFVKPARAGSSLGIVRVTTADGAS